MMTFSKEEFGYVISVFDGQAWIRESFTNLDDLYTWAHRNKIDDIDQYI